MTSRLFQRVGFVLCAFLAGCGGGGTSALQAVPQTAPQSVSQQQASDFGDELTPLAVATSAPITGTATICYSFSQCNYTITDAQGTGSASTSGTVTFQLPGEANFSTSQAYTTNILGNVGTTYHVGGSFTATDVNTERIVTGTTDDYIIQTKYCFRSCSYHYSLVSGTISFVPTNIDATATAVACNPSTFGNGGSTKCTATVTDLANASIHPGGHVTFSISSYYGAGTFTPVTCTLSKGRCSTKFAPTDESVGGIGIGASYPGNKIRYPSSGSTSIYVTGN
ncbi:MAG: hypothetical protein JOZ38_10035 [Candidatus Eremiobacteraeota bacterium]|nr:hypothetical protein [Candidatus Eremiobacteraeota bacterium]